MAAQQAKLEKNILSSSVDDSHRLRELLSPRLPFGLPSGKVTASINGFPTNNQGYTGKHNQALQFTNSINSFSFNASPGISQDETQLTSNFIPPQIRGTTNTNTSRYTHKLGSPSVDRHILVPGTLTLDTDSEADASKLQIREKLLNVSTTRNIRNKTIDVPSMIGSE